MKTWNDFFNKISSKEYYLKLMDFLDKEYSENVCYPPKNLLYNAFDKASLEKIKVVIVGQDPYHEPGQAMGLCFSVPDGIELPPSLKNIYKEIVSEYNCLMNMKSGDLTYLTEQGVFLINAILSVREHKPLSHNIPEYNMLLSDVLDALNNLDQPIVFMLWGGPARKLKSKLSNPKHLVLEANHPSPLSANRGGWFGCNHFKLANEYLTKNNLDEIEWSNFS